MKLSTIKQALEKNIPLLKSLTQLPGSNPDYIKFERFNIFKQAVSEIKALDIFHLQILLLEKFKFYVREIDVLELRVNEAQLLDVRAKELINAIEILNTSLDKILIENENDDENIIFIKLPNTSDLEVLAQEIQNFHKILSLTVLDIKIGGQILLETVEPGSIWLKVNLGVAAAVTLVGSLAWSSAVVYKKYQEGKIIEEVANSQKLENEHKKNLINASKVLTDFMINIEAENIYNTYYQSGETDNEQIERIKLSIKMLSEEIHKGAEVIPALTAPEEVSNLFPDMNKLSSIESKIKRIEDK